MQPVAACTGLGARRYIDAIRATRPGAGSQYMWPVMHVAMYISYLMPLSPTIKLRHHYGPFAQERPLHSSARRECRGIEGAVESEF